MHIGSLNKMEYFSKKYMGENSHTPMRILDVGAQDVNGSYQSFFDNPNWMYTGCDMVAGKNVELILQDVYNWQEIDDEAFDVVVTGQTFEHIEYFWITMLEIARVLKEGGMCCIIAPSSGFEHRYPVDCWRFYPDGFRALVKYASLEILEVFTDWNGHYPDKSELWKDSVLICRKPFMNEAEKQNFIERNDLSKRLVATL